MKTLNEIRLLGRVRGPISYRTTAPSAADLVTFQLATEPDTDQAHNCVCWGPIALQLHEHLLAGCQFAVAGTLRYHQWRDRNGTPRRRPEIVVSNFIFLD